jgi:hypothetical protein
MAKSTCNSGPRPRQKLEVGRAQPLRQPRDKNCSKLRASLRSSRPIPSHQYPIHHSLCTCKIPSFLFAIIVARSSLNQLCRYTRSSEYQIRTFTFASSPEPSIVPPPLQANRYLPRVATWIPPTNCQRNLSRTNGEEQSKPTNVES